MKRMYTFLLLLFYCTNLFSADFPDVNARFPTYFQGVQYAVLDLDAAAQADVDARGNILLVRFASYLESRGIVHVAITSNEKEALYNSVGSMCDIVNIDIDMDLFEKQYFTNHKVVYTSCLGEEFVFESAKKVRNDQFALDNITRVWEGFFSGKTTYNETNRLKLPVQPTGWSGSDLKSYFENNQLDPIEGLYEKKADFNDKNQYAVGIVKNENGGYTAVYLEGAVNHKDWMSGEVLGYIYPTANQSMYKAHWCRPDKKLSKQVYMSMDMNGMLFVNFQGHFQAQHEYMKLFPRQPFTLQDDMLISTGTGTAISNDGYILTNYHVVEGGSVFKVGVTQEKSYNAVLLGVDTQNDLALLKVSDPAFSGMPKIPYNLKFQAADVGQEVFTLGYPLAGTMGWEVKYTNGTVSARSGFEGDVSTYQTTVSVEPGSSGGPLFDTQGNLVGVIKAKHSQANNATYAIKTRNLFNLLDTVQEEIRLSTSNQLKGKVVTDQINTLKQFVFYVKVY